MNRFEQHMSRSPRNEAFCSAAYAVLLSTAILISLTSCRRDMFNQPFSKPLERNDFFKDNQMASRPVVPFTVARGRLEEDEGFQTGKISTNLLVEFPVPVTRELVSRGRERFNIYCSPCHGRTGAGNGMIVQRGFPAPPSYHIDRLRQAPAGHFVDVITRGYGIMYSYGDRIGPEDRWAIAAYIRALQMSRQVAAADLSPDQRAKLAPSR